MWFTDVANTNYILLNTFSRFEMQILLPAISLYIIKSYFIFGTISFIFKAADLITSVLKYDVKNKETCKFFLESN